MFAPLHRRLAPPALAIMLAALGGCATDSEVRVEFDRHADFTQYRSFGFLSPLGTDRGGFQTMVSQYLLAATQRQLEARGLKLDPVAPQLMVNFNTQVNEKLRFSTLTGPGMGGYYGYYGYRGGFYAPWPMYRDQTLVTPYNEGTLNIDLVDVARKQMVWEGVVVSSMDQKETSDLRATIDGAVNAAFSRFPITLPTAAPASTAASAPPK